MVVPRLSHGGPMVVHMVQMLDAESCDANEALSMLHKPTVVKTVRMKYLRVLARG